jgi:hypothetical protein
MKNEETSNSASDKAFYEHEDTKAQSRYRRIQIPPWAKYHKANIAKQISRS